MNFQQDKFVRFRDWNSDKGSESNSPAIHITRSGTMRNTLNSVSEEFQRGLESSLEGIKRFRRSFKSLPYNRVLARSFSSGKKILDPQGPFLQKWNKIFVLSCLIAVSLDPLFFYVPVIDDNKKCLSLDRKMEITATVLRSFSDIFYIIHIIFQFRTGFIAPSSRVFGRGVLVEDAWAIAMRYLSSYFLIDILAVLPLPQVAILIIIPKLRGSLSLNTKTLLKFIVFFQYIPRFLRIIPLYKEVTRTSGILTETAWAGAAFNLFLYMLASHVIGAFWYLFSIERETTCWQDACRRNSTCNTADMYCDPEGSDTISAFLNASCPIQDQNTTLFNFGIFLDALQSGVVESRDFPQKFFYCFWWGLRNLSSLGQNLATSTYVWEICFAIFISIAGLVLFAFLIGNMQTYLQSTTTRLEEMRVKRRDAEQWMSHRLLPDSLRERIRRHEQYKWQETRGVDEDSLVRDLPKDLRRDIKRHLCLALLMRVPMFEKMDDQLLDAMCDRLKPVLYTEESCIVREGDPVDEMLFIMRGKLLTVTTNAWRRYSKKKLEESLREEENRLQDALAKAGGSSPSLGATIYASRFAANALRLLRRNSTRKTRVPERISPMMLQKPAEPDFTSEEQ
ncbi:Cyclic nucleotide-gated ion channel 1 [Spatholobus suberectus]|nr:Cyclic nucleotide-gated ion channel 1 [Spatholobus suberectus]